MSKDVSTVRLYLLRMLYLLNLVLLGAAIWPMLLKHEGMSDPVQAAAYSFWGALAALSAIGLRYPLRMLPILFMQLLYKSIWICAAALPQWHLFHAYTRPMVFGIVLDLIAMPWSYVYAAYIKEPGDRWLCKQ